LLGCAAACHGVSPGWGLFVARSGFGRHGMAIDTLEAQAEAVVIAVQEWL
jgi:hypothetical protein